jgi:ferredoxin-type protein NapH
MIIQLIRRGIQLGVLALIGCIAMLSLYAHYRSARVVDDEVLMSGLTGEFIAGTIHPYIDNMEDTQAFIDANKGTLWSMQLGGINLTDPLAAAEAVAATHSVHWPLLISIIIPVIATALLGKIFCSWICPGYLLFEIAGKLRKLLRIAEINPANVKFSHANKYVFLVVGLALAAIVGAPLFALIYPPAVISRVVHAWIFGTELAGMLILLGVILAFEVFVSPRWWCQTMCPGGALYSLLGRFRVLRVRLRSTACTGCRECIPVCEAGINPITQSQSMECDNCGVCLTHCSPGALYYTIGLPTRTQPVSPSRRPLSSIRAGVLIGLLLPFMFVDATHAHHVLGLPHYSYKENYPQRPTLEYPATSGPYDILLTSYPGNPIPGEPTNLAFYLKNRNTSIVYANDVHVRVLQTSTFGDNVTIMTSTAVTPFDNQHKFQCTFPDPAEYIVELSVMIEGRVEVIPFGIVSGQPTATASFVLAGGTFFVGLFVVIRAIRIKRKRRTCGSSLDLAPAAHGALP